MTKGKGAGKPPSEPTPGGDGWLNLWGFAQRLAPKTCGLAARWADDQPIVGMRRAEGILIATDPHIMNAVKAIKAKLREGDDEAAVIDAVWTLNPRFMKLLNQQIELRITKRRHLVPGLLMRVSFLVKAGLLSGKYEVAARAPDGRAVNLTPRDLAGLDVDLNRNTLVGDGTIYSAVRVRAQVVALPAIGEAPAEQVAPDGPARIAVRKPVDAKRRHTGLDYRPLDAPLVGEMRTLIDTGGARSPEDAARVVWTRAAGHGQAESKVKRLALHYRLTFPAQS